MIMPTVSVVVPTYNSEKYLCETLESVLSQIFEDIEIIVVDDCSTDNTKEIINRIASEKVRYFCLDNNHGGPSRARNVGIRQSRGKFIAFCDSDDLFEPGHLADAVRLFSMRPELGMTFTDLMKFDDLTCAKLGSFLYGYDRFHSLPKESLDGCYHVIQSNDSFPCLFFENYILPSGAVVRREVLDSVGLFDESLKNGDDRDMWFRITRNYPVGFIDKIGFNYRVRGNSVSRRGPSLALNRLRVIYKQIDSGLPKYLQGRCNVMIANNYYGIGYHYQQLGHMRKAREYYLHSMKAVFSFTALKGMLITFAGSNLYFSFRKIRQFLS